MCLSCGHVSRRPIFVNVSKRRSGCCACPVPQKPWQKTDYKVLPQSVVDHGGAEGEENGWTTMPAVLEMPVQVRCTAQTATAVKRALGCRHLTVFILSGNSTAFPSLSPTNACTGCRLDRSLGNWTNPRPSCWKLSGQTAAVNPFSRPVCCARATERDPDPRGRQHLPQIHRKDQGTRLRLERLRHAHRAHRRQARHLGGLDGGQEAQAGDAGGRSCWGFRRMRGQMLQGGELCMAWHHA
jgi:hypothetical protein